MTIDQIKVMFKNILDNDIVPFIELINENSGILGLCLGGLSLFFSYKIFKNTFRPIIHIEIEEKIDGNYSSAYNISIENVGNQPAKNINYKLVENYNEKEWNEKYESQFTNLKEVKARLTGSVSILQNGSKKTGLLCDITEGSAPLNWEDNNIETKKIKILVSYNSYFGNFKYVEEKYLSFNNKKEYLTGLSV
jgi:hypothetical protein